jgi:hypothetical protein
LYGATISTGQPNQFHFVPSENKELRVTYQSVPKVGVITMRFGLINCLLFNSIHPRILNHILRFSPLGRYSVFEQKLLSGEPQVTVEVEVIASPLRIATFENAMSDVALLISFALGTYVPIAYTDILVGNSLVSSVIHRTKFLDYNDKVPVINAGLL